MILKALILMWFICTVIAVVACMLSSKISRLEGDD